MKVSFNTFEEYCKKCEFYEYESISHKHYCYKNKILKYIPLKKRIKVNLDKTGEECEWQKRKKDNCRTYEVYICDEDTSDNHKYSVSVKSNLDAENRIKTQQFAEGLKSAFPDFEYNNKELTKEFIEGFLKGKMISRFQSSNTSNSKPNPDGDTNLGGGSEEKS